MPERRYEQFLRTVLQRCLGATVVHVDDGSRNGMHDAEIRYPNGRVAAVEFTTVGERSAIEMQSVPSEFLVPSTPYWWTLRYPASGVQWKEIQRYVPTLIALADQRNIWKVDALERELRGLPAWDWYERNDLTLSHFGPTTGRGGRVDLLPQAMGGVVDTDYATLNAWIAEMQAEPWWEENVTKLTRSGHEELHLALRVHESKVPFGVLSALMDGGSIQVGDPAGIEPLTDLWLVIEYGTNAAHWSRTDGWTVKSYATPEEVAATSKKDTAALRKILEGAERALNEEL